jgi:hypothetical protein
MRRLGAPRLRAVWCEAHGEWVDLEGSHRLRACAALGILPDIDEVEYRDDVTSADLGLDLQDELTVAEIVDGAWERESIEPDAD